LRFAADLGYDTGVCEASIMNETLVKTIMQWKLVRKFIRRESKRLDLRPTRARRLWYFRDNRNVCVSTRDGLTDRQAIAYLKSL
jgi:hypothetical protein